jgi:hypothetical protein
VSTIAASSVVFFLVILSLPSIHSEEIDPGIVTTGTEPGPDGAVESGARTPHDPIFISGDADLTNGDDDGISNPGAAGTPADPFVIEDWAINASAAHGIQIGATTKSILVRNVHVYNSTTGGFYGIVMSSVRGVRVQSSLFTNDRGSIVMDGMTSDVNVSANSIQAGTLGGIWVYAATNNVVRNVSVYGNAVNGTQIGVEISRCCAGTLQWVNVSRNLITNSTSYGIYMRRANWSNVFDNRLQGGLGGVYLSNVSNSSFTGNHISGATSYGISVPDPSPDWPSANNSINHNNLVGNAGAGKDASDALGGNSWNDSTGGNYWGDYSPGCADVAPPAGICDVPYTIDGAAGATDFLPLKDQVPVVAELSPSLRLAVAASSAALTLAVLAPLRSGRNLLKRLRV